MQKHAVVSVVCFDDNKITFPVSLCTESRVDDTMIIDLRTFLCFAAVVSGTLWTRRRYIEDPRRSIAQNRLYGKKSYKRYLRLQEQRQQGTLKQKKRRLKQKWKNHLLAMPEGMSLLEGIV